MALLLVVAVIAPVVGAGAGALLPERALAAGRIGALVAAASWFALLAHGSLVSVSRLHSVPLVAAAGCGASIAAAAVDAVAVDRPALVGVGLAATSVAVAAGRTATDGGGLVLALAIAATAMAAAGRLSVRVWVPAAVGLAIAAAGVVALRSAANSWALPLPETITGSHRTDGLLILAGAALLIAAGSHRARAPAGVLVPAGAFLAVQAAPLVHRADGFAPAAIVLALAAMAAALAARFGRPLLDRPTAALALFALAAMVGPGSTRGAGLLLAAGGTLSCALGWPAAAVLGLPGGVALAIALSGRGGGVALVEGALAGAMVVALAAAALRERPPPRPAVWTWPAIAVGGWLLAAPGTWGWVGPAGLRTYDLGAGRALAAASLCLVALAYKERAPTRWYARGSPPDSPGEDVVRH